MKTTFSTSFFIVLPFILCAQIYDWGRMLESSPSQGWSSASASYNATDPLGNIVLIGNTIDTVHLGGVKAPPNQGFMAKYGPDGTLLWGKSLAQTACGSSILVASLDIDSNGDIVVAFNCAGRGSANADFVIKKFDPQGNEIFTQESTGPGSGQVAGISVGPTGEIYATGLLFNRNRDTLFLGGVGVPGQNRNKPFLFKLDAMGNGVWAKSDQTTPSPFSREYAQGSRVAVDKQGNVYLMGLTLTDLDFGNGVFLDPERFTNGELFVVKFDSTGLALWGEISDYVGSSIVPEWRGMEVDNDGQLYLAGNFMDAFKWGNLIANPPGSFFGNFLLCISDQGSPLWMRHIQLSGEYTPQQGGVALDTVSNEIYFMGVGAVAILDSILIDYPDCGSFSGSNSRAYVAAFDKNGTAKWIYGTPCLSSDQEESSGSGISVDHKGGIYVSGYVEHAIFALDTLNAPIKSSPFLAKLLTKEISLVGRVFRDFNGNGVMDSLDMGLEGLSLENSPLNLVDITDGAGTFQFGVDVGTHVIRLPFLPQHHTLVNPTDSTYEVPANDNGQVIGGLNFALFPTPNIHDLEVKISPQTPVRPGFLTSYQISCRNVGSTPQTVQLQFVHPDILVYTASSIPFTTYDNSTSTLSWDLGNFAPYESQSIEVSFQVPVATVLGTSLSSTVQVFPLSGDIEPLDNQDSLHQVTTGSFDPNDKLVLSSPVLSLQMLADREAVDYLIRFQNTGTDTAFTVIVEDKISTQLDWKTFKMLDASHDYRLSTSEDGLYSWRFDNILLPDSNVNEAESHGFIRFQIIPEANLPGGDTISNQAAIFFDYNEAVLTPFVHIPISSATPIEPQLENGLGMHLYPNPGDGNQKLLLEIPYSDRWSLIIRDIVGRVVYEETLNLAPGKHELVRNWKSLPDSWYALSVSNQKTQITRKWIKK